jgi:Tfp pilus assembly PilM family ATPase
MAELLNSVIGERKMVGKRCAVILPAVAFTTIPLCIEAELTTRQALKQLGEAGSAVQLPFPRNQADLDLIDVTDRDDRKSHLHRSYLLMAVQRSNTDRLVKTFQQANLELQFVDSGLLAPLRLIQAEIAALQTKQQLLHLNLAPGVTTCTTVWRGGPQKLQRLAPVRPYPLFLDQSNEDYFPLAPEDLLSLGRDLRKLMKQH